MILHKTHTWHETQKKKRKGENSLECDRMNKGCIDK